MPLRLSTRLCQKPFATVGALKAQKKKKMKRIDIFLSRRTTPHTAKRRKKKKKAFLRRTGSSVQTRLRDTRHFLLQEDTSRRPRRETEDKRPVPREGKRERAARKVTPLPPHTPPPPPNSPTVMPRLTALPQPLLPPFLQCLQQPSQPVFPGRADLVPLNDSNGNPSLKSRETVYGNDTVNRLTRDAPRSLLLLFLCKLFDGTLSVKGV